MTATLLLKLKGPMQSWGADSRQKRRDTRPQPTKSGVLGLIAAAQGRSREADLEDLARLSFAVRVDAPGEVLRDYQTAEDRSGKTNLVSRYYLTDAVFVVAIEAAERVTVESLKAALERPVYPLFLGRRSCPANRDLVIGIKSTDAITALVEEKWHATAHHQRRRPQHITLPIFRDAKPGEASRGVAVRDVPVSYSQEFRKYDWRTVVEDERYASIDNPTGTASRDPFFEAVISA
ncbi:type I-E CRISPR-associated protein Cas5/CasD [Brevibacterium sp. BRM-1]|uniref:type I-E CRISPR-associated protein Cas5/CasD n=1 Tax=Brevibacterium sp. BRM-1 TaxID=2999062 RepID=UPI00227F8ECB|nr:type I-E CRISPR-associated protein Cas5/CasD [Brevibacterium sp. BRM-1]WAL39140.1 type I-E CRISPR-associated protein Cas5/CasD [Brevibacterium sp. BRM-1]